MTQVREAVGERFRIRFGIGTLTLAMTGLMFRFIAYKFMNRNRTGREFIRSAFYVTGLFTACIVHGQTNSLVMPMIGESFPTSNFELVNQIPKARIASLPKSLPIFRYSSTLRKASCSALQELMNLSAFKGTNISDLFDCQSNVLVMRAPVRLATVKNSDYFAVDPSQGSVSFYSSASVNLRTETPAYDSIPSFESIQGRVLSYAKMFGVSTNEMEHKEDGALLLRRTDGTTVARGGAVKFISRRSVGVSRSVAGYSFLGNDEKVELVLGVNGRLQQFDLRWRPMEAVRTNQTFAIEKILKQIKEGRGLANVMNQYPNNGVAQIILKDIRILYYVPMPELHAPVSIDTDICPIASLRAIFKSKTGETEEGALYLRLTED